MSQRYLTCQEIADAAARLNLTSVPRSKAGVQKVAKREGWADNKNLARKRTGSQGGGGFEYHVSLLPDVLQSALMGEVSKGVMIKHSADNRAVELVKRTALDTASLTARQRRVMDARSAILTAIEGVQIAGGHSRRQAILMAIEFPEQFDLKTELIETANDRSSGRAKLSRSSLFEWFKCRDENGVGALAPKATKEKSDIPAWFWDFMKHYARPQKPCMTEALDAFLRSNSRPNEDITYPKVRRLIAKLGNVEKHRGREGSLTLKSRMAYVTRSTGDLLPTCVYTSDGKTFDAEIQHPIHGRPFRPEITAVVDVATRRCVGFSVGLAENAEGVVDALRHSCEQFGVPAIFYVDRGSGFKNQRLDDQLTGLMGRLGITKHHSLPQNSQARGIIERFHGSVWNPLSREFDTFVGVEMDRQARQKSFKVTRKEQREVGASKSLPSWDQFLEGCNRAITVYNSKAHSSLPNRMSPDEYWQWHVDQGFEAVTVTANESADLFRPYVKRKVRRCLIEWKTNTYFHIALQEFDGDEVLAGFDIHDGTKIWVREIDRSQGDELAGRLICIAEFAGNEERYIPLSMERDAMEKRQRARIKRLDDKKIAVNEELQTNHFLEAQATPQAPFIEEFLEPVTVMDNCMDAPQMAASKQLKFSTDAELARWVIENPEELKGSQRSALEMCLSDYADRQLLLDQGIDVERLIAILRHAA